MTRDARAPLTRDELWREFARRVQTGEALTEVWFTNMVADLRQREQTAATIFAALIHAAAENGDVDAESALARNYLRDAVALTDALRDELGRGR